MPGSEIQAKLFFFGGTKVIFLRPEIPVQNFCAAYLPQINQRTTLLTITLT